MHNPMFAKLVVSIAVIAFFIFNANAFDSYYIPLNNGTKVKVTDVFVSTADATQKKTLIIRYIPAHSSPNMWKHIVEMFDVASYFASDAKEKHIDTLGVTPLFNVSEPNDNTAYEYSVHDDTPVSADWRLEWQPWFYDNKGEQDAAANP